MKTFKSILVGIDFSQPSKQALKQAARIAEEEGSKLTALHVVAPSEVEEYQRYYTVPRDVMVKAFRTGIEDILEEELGARDAAECQIAIGVPYHELIRCAGDMKCDLLVLGSRGGNAAPHEVGFFAAKCVRHASVPVLLTRRVHGESFKRIVACVDFSAATQEVIETGAKMALDEHAELHVVHAVCPPWMRPTHVLYNLQTVENNDYKAEYRELLAEQMEAAVKLASQFLPINIEPKTLEHPNPSQAIIDYLKESEADLAVVGRRGSTGTAIKHFLIGSTAERIIHRSPCSVVTVPCND